MLDNDNIKRKSFGHFSKSGFFFYQVQLMISKGCEYSLPVVVTESTDSSKSSVSVDVETTLFL
jgi:hypothetical protein